MRMVRMISCSVWLVACCLLVPGAQRPDEPARSDTKVSLRDSSEPVASVDDTLVEIAGVSSACEGIGGFADSFIGTNRFRGDVFSIEKQVDLIEIKMELGFRTTPGNPTDLYFYVFEESAEEPPTFEPIFESVVSHTGDGQLTYYASGPVEASPGVPLTLELGKRYAIGAAWSSASGFPSSINYGSDGLNYPRPFVAGQVEGLVSFNSAPPLTTLGTPTVFTSSGAYSLQLCFTGACCTASGCEDKSQFECGNLGGEFTAAGITCADDLNDTCALLSKAACCLGDETCFDLNEFACGASGGAWNESGFLCGHPSEPCAPRGACCLPEQGPPCQECETCTVATENNCAQREGTYRGDDVTCEAFPGCGAGACCVDEACAELTPANCADQVGGVFSGPGTSCDTEICIPTGACCDGLTCDDVIEESCVGFGLYRGDGTSCETLTTACGKGACCLRGSGCFDGASGEGEGISQLFCANLDGVFRGDGSTCDSISPGCEGACCFGPGGLLCTEQAAPEDCWSKLGGDFAGYFAFACPADPALDVCPVAGAEACCLPSGGCTETDDVTCRSLQGIPNPGQNCGAGLDCSIQPPPTGACCDGPTCTGDGDVKTNCTIGSDPSWIEGATCGDVPNPCLPVGACCDGTTCASDGGIQTDCTEGVPIWLEGETCGVPDPCAPRGSCCYTDTFVCQENVVEAGCPAPHRWVQGGTCATAACTPPVGACCAINSSVIPACSQQTEADCASFGGQYKDDDVSCAAAACGACCQLIGTCQDDLIDSECDDIDDFRVGVTCASFCAPRGACCIDGTCSEPLTATECGDFQGVYVGDATQCSSGACDVGACCGTDEACVDGDESTRMACEAGDGTFLDKDSTCSEQPNGVCQRGVCCAPDATCTDDGIILDCTHPEEFIAGSTECAAVECLQRGACCLPDQPCELRSEPSCDAIGGTFAGIQTHCEADLCSVGACCDGVVSCATRMKLDCDEILGTYAGAGSLCTNGGQDGCTLPRGACCDGGACKIEIDENCTGGVKKYAGNNVSCDDGDPCTNGACCLAAGGCNETGLRFECEERGDTFLGAGIACLGAGNENECVTQSCCGLDGTCTDDVYADVCEAEEGLFDADHTCEGVVLCEARGCCCEGGLASITTKVACGGTYLGDGKGCAGVDCARGACCNGESLCSEMSPAFCAAAHDNYFGDGTTCEELEVDCSVGVCCSRTNTCSDDSRQDCELAGGRHLLGGGTECATDPTVCIPRGACCITGSCSEEMMESDCEAANGTYAGDDTLCGDGVCDVGACCGGNEICSDTSTRFACEAGNGKFFDTGLTCSSPDDPKCLRGVCCEPDASCTGDQVVLECADPGDFVPGLTDCDTGTCSLRGACCMDDDSCTTISETACGDGDGTYAGDGTRCEAGSCSIGACCLSIGGCEDVSFNRRDCEANGDTFLGGDVLCLDTADGCTTGSCCGLDGTCSDDVYADRCEADGGVFDGSLACSELTLCEPRGCCCSADEGSSTSAANCTGPADNYFGDGTTCAGLGVTCAIGACCIIGGECEDMSELACGNIAGVHQLGGTECASSSCSISIRSSTPRSGSIDARQPSDPEGLAVTGWDSIDISLTGNLRRLFAPAFVVELLPGGEGVTVPIIADFSVNGSTASIQLDRPIPVGHWTIIRHILSDTVAWIGYLPGDVNGNGIVATGFDIAAMISCLNNPGSCDIWQCDANRSEMCTPADILRVIDMLKPNNDVGAYAGMDFDSGFLPVFP